MNNIKQEIRCGQGNHDWIKIGNVTLSTANIPDNGIDLTKLSEEKKENLSIFTSS